MKILLTHNYYQQPGGEDSVFEAEKALLESKGHKVLPFVEHNKNLDNKNILQMAINPIWSVESYRRIKDIIKKEKPDVAHFHNIYYILSPSVYYACKEMGVPVVQSLHNQRMFCPRATIYREKKNVCTDCLKYFFPIPGIIHKCYGNSYVKTLGMSIGIAFHRWVKTWDNVIDIYVVFTEFYRNRFIEWGIKESKLYVKPHFIPDEFGNFQNDVLGEYVAFIGRLDPQKGIKTLIEAWKQIESIPLKIRGDGFLENYVEMNLISSIEIIRKLSKQELIAFLRGSRFLVWPSYGWYENFGLVAVEAFACGIPVIASNTGVMPEIVADGNTGILFEAGNAEDLARKVKWAWEHPEEMKRMGDNARKEYEEKYTPDRNYEMLMDIYNMVIENNKN